MAAVRTSGSPVVTTTSSSIRMPPKPAQEAAAPGRRALRSAGRCFQNGRDDIEARLNGDDHPRLEIEVKAQVSAPNWLERIGARHAARSRSSRDREHRARGGVRRRVERACAPVSTAVSGSQVSRPSSVGCREDLTASKCVHPDSGAGANESDASRCAWRTASYAARWRGLKCPLTGHVRVTSVV